MFMIPIPSPSCFVLLDVRNAACNVLADLNLLYRDLGRDFLLVAQNSIQLASFI